MVAKTGTIAKSAAELSARRMLAAMHTRTTSTPAQPLIAHAGRSWISTRVPESPTGVASGWRYGWSDWFMVPPRAVTDKIAIYMISLFGFDRHDGRQARLGPRGLQGSSEPVAGS